MKCLRCETPMEEVTLPDDSDADFYLLALGGKKETKYYRLFECPVCGSAELFRITKVPINAKCAIFKM